jgi:hypothetical protein
LKQPLGSKEYKIIEEQTMKTFLLNQGLIANEN